MSIETVYDEYASKVYKFFYIKCFQQQVAEDLTSQTFMYMLEKMQSGVVITDHKKYVYGVMRNVWMSYLRQKYRAAEYLPEDMDNFESYTDEFIQEYEAQTVKERASTFIARLPASQQQVVHMRLLEERSVQEIAAQIGKDKNYVKTNYKRGIKRLRELVMAQHAAQEVLA